MVTLLEIIQLLHTETDISRALGQIQYATCIIMDVAQVFD